MIVRIIFLVLLLLATGTMVRAEEITVAAAISLKESLEAIRPQYESSGGDRVKFTFASSGQLVSQVQNGAPIDLFLSAARKQVDDLRKAGSVDEHTAVVVAGNELVLIVPADAKDPPTSFEQLADAKVRRLAIGEPRTVPAGEYAQQVLEHLNLKDKLKGRVIYGLNVRQVLQYVQSGEVDAGIVYASDADEAKQRVKLVTTARPEWHEPIEYWAVIVAGSSHATGAKQFLTYLQSEAAQAIFKSHGFAKPTTAPAK